MRGFFGRGTSATACAIDLPKRRGVSKAAATETLARQIVGKRLSSGVLFRAAAERLGTKTTDAAEPAAKAAESAAGAAEAVALAVAEAATVAPFRFQIFLSAYQRR